MKVIFFGTPLIAAEVLEYLVENGVEVLAIVTKVDKPLGRSGKPAFSAVKALATTKYPEIPLFQPDKASTPAFEEELRRFGADLFVVFAYGEIMKQHLLDLPRHGCINLHPSLLPKFRGPAPIRYTLLEGEKEAGVTIIEMVLKMDAGDILAQEKVPVPPEMNNEELEKILIPLGAQALFRVIKNFSYHFERKRPQDPSQATIVPLICPEMVEIDWAQSAEKIHNQIRAFSPKPGAWCRVEIRGKGQRLKILRSQVTAEVPTYQKDRWIVPCSEGALSLLEVQLEGKNGSQSPTLSEGFRSLRSFSIKIFIYLYRIFKGLYTFPVKSTKR